MKKAYKTIMNLLFALTVLFTIPLLVSAAEAPTLEQIKLAGDYNVGSIYGPRLNQTELDQVAGAVLTFVQSYDWTGMDDFTKVYYAHQYLCDICEYAPDWSKNRANTAWGALVYGEAQCSGYARAFKALCDAIGIGCYYVHADENAWNPDHQWNEVCVDGVWYIIDVQCNDDSGFPAVYLVSGDTYAYCFGMSWNHEGLPECTQDYDYWESECSQPSQEVLQTQPLTLQDIPMGNGMRETITNDVDGSYYVNEYDESGNLVKCIYCNADGTVWLIEEYEGECRYCTYYNEDGTVGSFDEYDQNGDLVKSTYYNADGTIDWYVVSEYVYEGNIRHKKSTYYHTDETLNFGTVSAFIYDDIGKEIEFISYYDDGTFSSHECYEYDADGKKVKCIYYEEDGTLSDFITYEYNAYGKPTITTFYNADGSVWQYLISEYDADGEWMGTAFWNADKTMSMPLFF